MDLMQLSGGSCISACRCYLSDWFHVVSSAPTAPSCLQSRSGQIKKCRILLQRITHYGLLQLRVEVPTRLVTFTKPCLWTHSVSLHRRLSQEDVVLQGKNYGPGSREAHLLITETRRCIVIASTIISEAAFWWECSSYVMEDLSRVGALSDRILSENLDKWDTEGRSSSQRSCGTVGEDSLMCLYTISRSLCGLFPSGFDLSS